MHYEKLAAAAQAGALTGTGAGQAQATIRKNTRTVECINAVSVRSNALGQLVIRAGELADRLLGSSAENTARPSEQTALGEIGVMEASINHLGDQLQDLSRELNRLEQL